MNGVHIILWLVVGNFVYQYFTDASDYSIAIERSYFQIVTYLVLLFMGYIK